MKTLHKIKTLLTDLRDKAQGRQWHVRCEWCYWTVRNLDHERFAKARAKNHHANSHDRVDRYVHDRTVVWHTRA